MVTRVHAELLALAGDTRSPRPSDRGTVRARDVNWGDRTRLQGRKSQTLAWVSLPASSSIVVYAHANIRRGTSLVSVSVEWGNGGASVTGDYRVIKRLRVPLVASMVKLSGRLVAPDGSPANASDAADVSAFVAEGKLRDLEHERRRLAAAWAGEQDGVPPLVEGLALFCV